MDYTDAFFVRKTGTAEFAKFKPANPKSPFGPGHYVLADGAQGAAVFSRMHADAFIKGLKDHDLERVPAIEIVTAELMKMQQKKLII